MNSVAIHPKGISAVNQSAADAVANAPAEASAPALLPDPVDQLSCSADVVAQIAAMLVRSLREDRNAARLKSAAEETIIKREGERRVAAMHSKADAVRAQGLWDGVGQIGGGALGAAGAGVSLAGEDRVGKVFGEGKDVFQGVSTLLAKGPKATQTDLDAEAEQHRVNADLASKRQQQLDDDVRDARELLSKVADFLRECNGASNSARQQAASIRV